MLVYIYLFTSIFIFGLPAFLSSTVLAYNGVLDLVNVTLVATLTTLVGDILYYSIGRLASRQGGKLFSRWSHTWWYKKLHTTFYKNHEKKIDRVIGFFDTHPLKTVFVSRFIIGFQTPLLIAAGMRRVRLASYFIVATFANIIFHIAIALAVGLVDIPLPALEKWIQNAELIILVTVMITVFSVFLAKHPPLFIKRIFRTLLSPKHSLRLAGLFLSLSQSLSLFFQSFFR